MIFKTKMLLDTCDSLDNSEQDAVGEAELSTPTTSMGPSHSQNPVTASSHRYVKYQLRSFFSCMLVIQATMRVHNLPQYIYCVVRLLCAMWSLLLPCLSRGLGGGVNSRRIPFPTQVLQTDFPCSGHSFLPQIKFEAPCPFPG